MVVEISCLSLIRSAAAAGDCETKCGDREGQPALCQYFCAQSSNQVSRDNIQKFFN